MALLWYNKFIEKSALRTEELEKLPKEMLVALCSNLSESFRILSEQSTQIQKQNEQLIKQIETLKEQIAIMTQQRFGRKSERMYAASKKTTASAVDKLQ